MEFRGPAFIKYSSFCNPIVMCMPYILPIEVEQTTERASGAETGFWSFLRLYVGSRLPVKDYYFF